MLGKVESYHGLSLTNMSIIPSNLTDGSGYILFGLVGNPTRTAFDFVIIDGEFYDVSGKLVGVQTAPIIKSNLLPDEKKRIQT